MGPHVHRSTSAWLHPPGFTGHKRQVPWQTGVLFMVDPKILREGRNLRDEGELDQQGKNRSTSSGYEAYHFESIGKEGFGLCFMTEMVWVQ